MEVEVVWPRPQSRTGGVKKSAANESNLRNNVSSSATRDGKTSWAISGAYKLEKWKLMTSSTVKDITMGIERRTNSVNNRRLSV